MPLGADASVLEREWKHHDWVSSRLYFLTLKAEADEATWESHLDTEENLQSETV